MAEHSAVNRRVVGSSPTCGANIFNEIREATELPVFAFPVIFPVSIFLNAPRCHRHVKRDSGHSMLASDTITRLTTAIHNLLPRFTVAPH